MKVFLSLFFILLHTFLSAENTNIFPREVSTAVDALMQGLESLDKTLADFSKEEQVEVLWAILARSDSDRPWRYKNQESIDIIISRLRSDPSAGDALSVLLKRAMVPKSGRQREGLFNIAREVSIPSVIIVVGDYLNDHRRFDQSGKFKNVDIYTFSPENSMLAARTLGGMNIAGSPLRGRNPLTYGADELAEWQLWWNSPSGRSFFELQERKSSDATNVHAAENQDLVPIKAQEIQESSTKTGWFQSKIAIVAIVVIFCLLLIYYCI